MNNAPRAWTTISGQTPADRVTAILGQEALRTVYFDPDFARVEVDTSVIPPRVVVTANPIIATLEARVAALEAMLEGAGTITVDTIEVRQIIAKGTGATPDLNVADLKIVVKTPAPGVYQEVFRVVGRIETDMDPAPAISFFGASANKLQTLAMGYVTADVVNALSQYNFVIEAP